MIYRPDAKRRRDNFAAFLTKMRAVDPSGAGHFEKMIAQEDIIEKIGRLSAPYGLHIDDVADAYSTYWINAYQAFQGRNPIPSRKQMAAVRDQAILALTSSPEFRAAGDAAKQKMAEALWVQAAILDVAIEQSKNDATQLKAVGDAAAHGALAMGLDFKRMTLTEKGFVFR